MTKDPIGPEQGGDFNPYRYAMNDPVNRVDPSGQCGVEVGLGATGQVVAGAAVARNLAFNFDFFSGDFEYGTTSSVQGNFGAGLYGGAGLNIGVTPWTNSLNELGGGYAGFGGNAGVGLVGGGGQLTFGSSGLPTFSLSRWGVGAGVAGGVVGGATTVDVKYRTNVYDNVLNALGIGH